MKYSFEIYTLDLERRELHRGGELRHVEPQVFDLLHFLIANRERVVSRDEIFQKVWHGRIVSDGVLSTRINAARTAVGDDGVQQRLIRTIRGSGVRFIGCVSASTPAAFTPSFVPSRRLAATLTDAPAIAVLPFACIGEDRQSRLIAEALDQEVVAALYEIGWLPVMSDCSAPQAIDVAAVREAARRSRARYLLLGSLRLERDDGRVIIRLTDATSGIHLWVEGFRLPTAGSFAVQREIAARVAGAVGDHIFAAENIRARRQSPEALGVWQTLVYALDLINSRNRQKADRAIAALKKAIDIDPQSSMVFGLLSFVATLGVHQAWHPRQSARSLAVGAAERAIALDDEDPWAHLAAGYARLYVGNRPAEAVEILKHALSLNPNLAMAHYLIALASTFIKKPDDAFEHAELAERLRARDLLARGNTGAHDNVRATASFVAGRYREGIAFARKTIAQTPRQSSAYRQLVINSAFAGERDQATQAVQLARRLGPELKTFIGQSEPMYADRSDYMKYVEGFRLAGYR